jgi:HD-GYP domain-containing protein (c-di-GMP phosphodiesterase class II)
MSARRRSTRGLEGLTTVDDDDQQKVERIGCDLVNRLFVLTRNTLLFDKNNKALNRPVEMLMESLQELHTLEEKEASIGMIDDNLFLNESLLKPDQGTYENSRFLRNLFMRLNAQEFKFDTGSSEQDIRDFMEALRAVAIGEKQQEIMSQLHNFAIVPLSSSQAADDPVGIDSRIQVLRTFASSIALMARVMNMALRGMKWRPALVRRVAYNLADASSREPNLMLGLIHLHFSQAPLGSHLVRVAVLSLLCAERVELARRVAAEAGLIALCHHFSKAHDQSYLEEEDLDTREDLVTALEDPLQAALALCTISGLNEGLIRRVIGVYEATGAIIGKRDLYQEVEVSDLLGRLVTLADTYVTYLDTLRPDEALRLLLHQHRAKEPELTKIFVNVIGLYPVGSMVELESGARAVVVEAPRRKQQMLRPVVQIVSGGSGLVDLSDKDHGHGRIVGSVDAAEAKQNVSHFFLL